MIDKPELSFFGMGEGDPSNIGQGPSKPVHPSHASTKALMHHLLDYVRDWWLKPSEEEKNDKTRSFSPMLIAVCANGDIVPIVAVMAFDEDQKEEFALNMRKKFQVWNVQRYAFISEAWVATYNGKDTRIPRKGGIPEHMRPVNRHDRKEVMSLAVVGKDEETEFYALELVRDWDTGLVTGLTPFDAGITGVKKGKGLQMSGRFMDLLKPPPYEGNPAMNPENMQQISMLSIILDMPEFMRERYEKFGQDFDGLQAKGRDIKARMEAAYKKLAKAPEPEWDSLCKVLEAIMGEAGEYGRQMLTDIEERQARERPAN
jgi:hypothetical protein